ncbi:hypothetical protein OFD71_33650, partial [Escherichia coli]|nr:hypothetical protein [Escherichia coli]
NAAEVSLIRRFDIATDVADRFLYAGLSLVTIGYTFLTSSAIEPLNCVALPDGSHVLKAAADVRCYTPEYSKYLPGVIIVSIIYVVGLPLALL